MIFGLHQSFFAFYSKKDQMRPSFDRLKSRHSSLVIYSQRDSWSFSFIILFFFLLYYYTMDTVCPVLNDGTSAISWIFVSFYCYYPLRIKTDNYYRTCLVIAFMDGKKQLVYCSDIFPFFAGLMPKCRK